MNEVCKHDESDALIDKNHARKKKSRRNLSGRLPVIGGKRASVLAVGMVVTLFFEPHAVAGTFDASDPASFNQALADMNVDPDPHLSQVVTLHANITIVPPPAGPNLLVVTSPDNIGLHTDNFSMNLTGAGTVWDTGSYVNFYLYHSVTGTDAMTITNGAVLRGNPSLRPAAGIFSLQAGDLRIDGNGSSLIYSGDFVAGRDGDAHIYLTNGATLLAGRTSLGEEIGSNATTITALVDGAGTVWNTGVHFSVGGLQNNVDVTVSNGGLIQGDPSGSGTDIGTVGTGSLLVTGAGSRFVLPADGDAITIGVFRVTPGHGTVTISNGGLVSSRYVVLASDVGTSGTLNVNSGGVLETGGLIYYPGTGTASATFDNGTLRASTESIPASVLIYGFSGTQLNIGPGGMIIDSNGFYTISSSVASGVGGLTKQGDGILNLTNTNTYLGPTLVSRGTLQAGIDNAFSAASAHTVAAGATLDTGGFNQAIAGLDNSGTVTLVGSAPGSTLRVTGNYVGHAGVLKLGTALGDSSSLSDRLVIDGPGNSASGTTSVQITNLGGLGAQTSGNGIEVISGINGATTTAQTTKSAFALAGGHVDAGAYEYRLFAADANGAGENWYLRSSLPSPPGGGTPPPVGGIRPPVVTFRRDVPLLVALPQQLRQGGLTMVSNLHQRVGDNNIHDGSAFADRAGQRETWGRMISVDSKMNMSGTVSPASEGRLTGFQAGTDLWANANWHTGLYVGQLEGDMSVTGFASGVEDTNAGSNSVRSQFFGAYATYRNGRGIYVDTVLQAGRIRYDASATGTAANNGKGSTLLASVEVGKSFEMSPRWRIEPQLQLVHQHMQMDTLAISDAQVDQDSDNSWTVRAGLRVKGEFSTGSGNWQPYGRVNLYRSNAGTDITRFTGPAGGTDIATRTGGTSSELVAGATVQLNNRVSLYGEVGKLWSNSDTVRLGSGVNGSIGAKMLW